MMSKKAALPFICRLAFVFVVGVSANLVADISIGRHWVGDFGNTIFQMFYVVMLIVMSFLTGTLRVALKSRAEQRKAKSVRFQITFSMIACTVIYGVMVAGSLTYFTMGMQFFDIPQGSSWLAVHAAPLLKHGPICVAQVAGILFLCHLACLYQASDMLAWLLLVFIYVPRIFIPWEGVGYPHNLGLFVWAMVVEAWSIRGRETFTGTVRNYWPLFMILLLLSDSPYYIGRCDLVPPNTSVERLKWYFAECFLSLCLMTGAFRAGDPHGIAAGLNYWALFAYCFHVAFARLLPIPYGAVLTYSVGVVYLIYHFATISRQPESSRSCNGHKG